MNLLTRVISSDFVDYSTFIHSDAGHFQQAGSASQRVGRWFELVRWFDCDVGRSVREEDPSQPRHQP